MEPSYISERYKADTTTGFPLTSRKTSRTTFLYIYHDDSGASHFHIPLGRGRLQRRNRYKQAVSGIDGRDREHDQRADEAAPAFIQPFLSAIEQEFTLDAANPPYEETEPWQWEPTCIEYFGKYTQAGFFYRHWLQEGKPKATYTINVESAHINNANGNTKMSMKTSNVDSTTSGWTIGGKVSVGASKGPVSGGTEVSASYSQTNTQSNTFTKDFSYKGPCEPGYECRFKTWTFHIEVKGQCKKDSMINYRDIGTWNQCDEPQTSYAQFSNFHDWHCNKPKIRCQVKTPLFDEAGNPYNHIIVSEPLQGQKRSELPVKYEIID